VAAWVNLFYGCFVSQRGSHLVYKCATTTEIDPLRTSCSRSVLTYPVVVKALCDWEALTIAI
jgi:hypothetical protein